MSSVPAGRREVNVRGDGNCFYRAMALAVNGKTDHAYPVFRAMCNKMIAEYPKVFEAYQFSSKTIKEHLKKSSKDGTWAETMDIFSCATVLQRTINVYSITSQKWTIFEPRVATQATITCNRSCLCPFTLILHDLHPIANHFNLLEPEGGCCEAPVPENSPQKFKIDLADHDTPFPSPASDIKMNLPKQTKRKRQGKKKEESNVKKATYCRPTEKNKAEIPNTENYVEAKPKSKTCKVKPIVMVKPMSSSCVDMSGENKAPDFERMKVKELKEYIQIRGVPVSAYKKPDLINLAKSLCEMNADIDPDFRDEPTDDILKDRLTLPSGTVIADPFKMEHLSNDFSNLPNFGLMDVFNHLIMSETEYDKEMLASWRSFDEYTLCQNGHVRSMQNRIVFDKDDSKYHLITAKVIPTQKDKTPEGDSMYSLWFILKPNGSVYSAFCTCKGGADQGCRHLGAALFELDDFLSKERTSVTSLPAYWNPKPMPETRPLPFMEMKMAHSTGLNNKRVMTNYDESWIDSFDPVLPKQRIDIPLDEQIKFANKLRAIDKKSGILDYLPGILHSDSSSESSESEIDVHVDISHMTISARAEEFARYNTVNDDNKDTMAECFVESIKVTPEEIDWVNAATVGQHKNDNWHEMRHLLVTGKKIKGLYTRQQAIEKNPGEDVTKTVHNFMSPKPLKTYPAAMEYGIRNEQDAKDAYMKIMKKKHANLTIEEPGLMLSEEHGWLGASPDGIRKCACCPNALLEIKCPYKGADMDPKEAFLLETVGGDTDKNGNYFLKTTHLHYFQIQTGMAVCGLKKCDFVVFTPEGIYVVNVNFDQAFWNSTIKTVKMFYTKNIISTLLAQM